MSFLENISEYVGSFENLDPHSKVMRSNSLTGSRRSSLLRQLCHDLFNSEERDMLKSALRGYRTGGTSLSTLCDCLGKLITNSNRMGIVEIISEMMENQVKPEFLAQCRRKIFIRNRKSIPMDSKCRRSATINIVYDHGNNMSKSNAPSTFYSPQLYRRGDNDFEKDRKSNGVGIATYGSDVHRAPYYSTPSLSTLPEESSESNDDVNGTHLYCQYEEKSSSESVNRRNSTLPEQGASTIGDDRSTSTESISSRSSDSNSSATVEHNPAFDDCSVTSNLINQRRTLTTSVIVHPVKENTPPPRPPPPRTSSVRSSSFTESEVRTAQENSITVSSSLIPHEISNIMISVAHNSTVSNRERSVSASSSLKSIKDVPPMTPGVIDRPRKIGAIVEPENPCQYAFATSCPVLILGHVSRILCEHSRQNRNDTRSKSLVLGESSNSDLSARCAFTQTGHTLCCSNGIQTEFIGFEDKSIQTSPKAVI